MSAERLVALVETVVSIADVPMAVRLAGLALAAIVQPFEVIVVASVWERGMKTPMTTAVRSVRGISTYASFNSVSLRAERAGFTRSLPQPLELRFPVRTGRLLWRAGHRGTNVVGWNIEAGLHSVTRMISSTAL